MYKRQRPDREQTAEVAAMKRVFTERLRGVVLARQYPVSYTHLTLPTTPYV